MKATCLSRDGALVHPHLRAQGVNADTLRKRGQACRTQLWNRRKPLSRRRSRLAKAQAALSAAERWRMRGGAAAAAMTGGMVDPTVFRVAIFVLAISWAITWCGRSPRRSTRR